MWWDKDGNVLPGKSILSGAQYYTDAGLNSGQKLFEMWNINIWEEIMDMSIHHCKTADWNFLLVGIRTIANHYESLWEEMLKKCRKRQLFHQFCRKKKVIARALESLKRDGDEASDVLVLYGNALFPSGGRGEHSVPVKGIKTMCKQVYDHFQDVDEYRSTVTCSCCGEELARVVEQVGSRIQDVHGLLWCSSDQCKRCPLKVRDLDAAKSIYNAYNGEASPLQSNPATPLNRHLRCYFYPPNQPHPSTRRQNKIDKRANSRRILPNPR